MNNLFKNYNEKANLAIKAMQEREIALNNIVKELQTKFPNGYIEFEDDNMPDFWDITMDEYQKVVFAKVKEDGELYFVVDSQDYNLDEFEDKSKVEELFFEWHNYGKIDIEELVWHLKRVEDSLESESICKRIYNALINTKIDKFKANLKEEFKDREVWFRSVDSKIDDGADNEEDNYIMMDAYDVIIGTEHFNTIYYVRMFYGDVSGEIGYVDVELS